MDASVVKISSKGQLVVPLEMRKSINLGKGAKVLLVQEGKSIVMQSVDGLCEDIKEELFLMKMAARGWADVKAGKVKTLSKEQFLKEIRKW